MKIPPIEVFWVLVAMAGGIARYLSNFATGAPFKFTFLFTSAFVSGFSGCMFALLGQTMSFPQNMLFVMAGVGGFMGDQAIKLLIEVVTAKTKPPTG